MEWHFLENKKQFIDKFKIYYPTGYVGLIEQHQELSDILLANDYKVVTQQPYPEFVRCFLIANENQSIIDVKKLNGIKFMFFTKFNNNIADVHHIFYCPKMLDSDIKLNLYRKQLNQLLILEDYKLCSSFSFEINKVANMFLLEIKNELASSELTIKEKVLQIYKIDVFISENLKNNTVLKHICNVTRFDDCESIVISYYLLLTYFMFTNKKKFVIMPYIRFSNQIMNVPPIRHNKSYKEFKTIIENCKTSYSASDLTIWGNKFKKIVNYKKVPINLNLMKEKIKVLAQYSDNCFIVQLIENGYL